MLCLLYQPKQLPQLVFLATEKTRMIHNLYSRLANGTGVGRMMAQDSLSVAILELQGVFVGGCCRQCESFVLEYMQLGKSTMKMLWN